VSGQHGEHQRDNARLIGTLLDLRKLGDTALGVERDEEWWRGASQIQAVGGGGPVGLALAAEPVRHGAGHGSPSQGLTRTSRSQTGRLAPATCGGRRWPGLIVLFVQEFD